jgi:DNA-binding response OmpR family regulator
MRTLVADDDPVSLRMVERELCRWGYDVVAVRDGEAALRELQLRDSPPLAVLNWMMPGMNGTEVCRKVRETTGSRLTYIILLTARDDKKDVVRGLRAGADDYITKPFDAGELRARVQVGERVIGLHSELASRANELEQALSRVKLLQGLLPICSYCKKIRADMDCWQEVDAYIAQHSEAYFSHAVCPDCHDRVVKPMMERFEGPNE